MQTHDAIRARRTAHAYKPTPVPPAVLERALAAANLAPCHRCTWPWRFLVLGPQTREGLVQIVLAVKEAAKGTLPDAQRQAIRRKMLDPGAFVVVTRVRHDDPFTAREDYAAVACAVQNFCLSLTADGFATKWGTGGPTRADATYTLLGVDPEAEAIEGFLYVGEPAALPAIQRPDVGQVVRRLP